MQNLLSQIKNCTICEAHLDLGANPVVSAHKNSKIVIVGQAPGTKVHKSGIPWDDASGKQLRKWLNISDEDFYNEELFAIIPMGFCYPGYLPNYFVLPHPSPRNRFWLTKNTWFETNVIPKLRETVSQILFK